MRSIFSFISALLVISSLAVPARSEEMYLCIWRNPERTMVRLFPEAKDYRTITRKIDPDSLKTIEARAGRLLPGQRDLFQYFELTGPGGALLGYIFAGSQKGEYGAIEFVAGLDKESRIKGVYIQRSREKENEFKSREFLDQFNGLTPDKFSALELMQDIPVKKRTAGGQAVLSGLKKELTAFTVLVSSR